MTSHAHRWLAAATVLVSLAIVVIAATTPHDVPVPKELKLDHLPSPAAGTPPNPLSMPLRMDNSILIRNGS